MKRTNSGARIGNSGLGAGLLLAALLAVASVGSAGTRAAGRIEPGLRIKLLIYNYATVSRGTLLHAEEEGSRIFREVGVEVTWLDCPTSSSEAEKNPACDPSLGAMAVDLRIVPTSMAESLMSRPEEVGFALPSDRAVSVSDAWVFYPRVEDLAEKSVASPSQILGYVIAHEIGHLLLGPNSHSRAGIMCGKWSSSDLQRAAQGILHFTSQQAKIIRAEVSTRNRMQQTGVLPGIATRK